MNKLLKILGIIVLLLAMPMKFFGQEVKNHIIEIELEKIDNPDFRYCILAHIANDANYEYTINEENNTVLLFSAEHWSDSQFQTYFDETMAGIQSDFDVYNHVAKENQGKIFASWKSDLPQDLFVLLFRLMLIENPNSRDGNQHCIDSDPFCTTDVVTFHVDGSASGVCESGPEYGCMSPYTARPPFWFHMKIGVAGTFTIRITNSNNLDLDFCAWGPFTDPTSPCPSQLTSGKIIDCDSPSNTVQECTIPSNAQVGQYYIMVITKYSSGSTDITFQKKANSGPGETDCGILPPLVENDGPFCVGDAIHLTANGQSGASYHWTGPNNYSSNLQNPTINNCNMTHNGAYTCTITLGNQSNNATTDVTIYAKPTANFTATTACKGEATQFTNTSTTNPSGQSITSYVWDFGDGQTSTQQNPTHTFANAGTYSVSLTTGIGNGTCTSTKTQNVTVLAQPVANAGNDTTVIYNAIAQLNGSGGAGSFNYHWEPANKVVNPNAQHTQTVPLSAQQTFTLTVTNPQGGCSSTDEMTVYISGSNMTLAPNATPPAICEGSYSMLNAHAGGGSGSFTYSWTPTTGLSNPSSATPTASPTTTTTYTCTASDGYTTLTASTTVTVNHPESSEETFYICPDETLFWHGQPYTNEGNYTFDTVTAHGCDKTIILHLHHYPSYDNGHTTNEYICPGESCYFHGNSYSVSGLYPEHLQTIHGCDSTVWLELTVYPENDLTFDSVTVCPEQLPYYFYGVPYDHATEVTHTDQDIHGCDSLVKLVLNISDYYMPDTEHHYIAYNGSPSFTWPVNGQTYTEEGFYIDTLPTAYCEGIFRLDLHFMEAPETIIIRDTACNNYTWWISGTSYDFEIPQGSSGHLFTQSHFDDMAPYHFENGTPCKQEYQLKLQMYRTSDHEGDFTIEGAAACDTYTWLTHSGAPVTYDHNGTWTDTLKSVLSNYHCDSIVTLTIRNMIYTPEPEIVCADNGIEWPHHPITATEFNVNKYTYTVVDPHGTASWINSQCQWKISKGSWPIRPSSDNLSCDVYAMDWVQDTVWLTFTAVNPCSPDGEDSTRYYLKPSFYGVQEQEAYPAAVEIFPNPNDGHMQLRFENLEGRLSINVFNTTGILNDSFEITTNQVGETYDYAMKRLGNGVYFFVVTDGKRSVTKKVVIIN